MRKALLTLAFGAITLPLGVAQQTTPSGPPDTHLGPPWRQNMGTTAPQNQGTASRSNIGTQPKAKKHRKKGAKKVTPPPSSRSR